MREFQRPVELAALKGRLERAQRVNQRIATTGERYDKVLDAIEEKEAQAAAHVGHLERYDGELGAMIDKMIGGSNQPVGPTAANGSAGQLSEAETAARLAEHKATY